MVASMVSLVKLGQIRDLISYILLHNKFAYLATYNNNKYVLSHNFCSSGIREHPSWLVLAPSLSWSCSEDVCQGRSHLKAWMELKGLLLRWLIHMFANWRWLLAGGLSSFTGLLWSSWHSNWLPPELVFLLQLKVCLELSTQHWGQQTSENGVAIQWFPVVLRGRATVPEGKGSSRPSDSPAFSRQELWGRNRYLVGGSTNSGSI